MQELLDVVPNVEMLMALEPEELGAKMVLAMRRNGEVNAGRPMWTQTGVVAGLMDQHGHAPGRYPNRQQADVEVAIAEAWSWLEAQGLLIPEPGANGQNGWRRLSRRANRFEDEAAVVNFAGARRLPKELLHASISEPCWLHFIRGDYTGAVFYAMRQVEIAVREAANAEAKEIGTKLMRSAFGPGGRLLDGESEAAEQEARASLFAGAIGSYKNPRSHRHVDLDDPIEAIELLLMASHLLRITEARKAALA